MGRIERPRAMHGLGNLPSSLPDEAALSFRAAGWDGLLADQLAVPGLMGVLGRAGVAMLHQRPDYSIVSVNDRCCDLLGRTAEAIAEWPLEAFVDPRDKARVAELYHPLGVPSHRSASEVRYVRPDGSGGWCDLHVCHLGGGGSGEPASIVTVLLDVTARREAEQKFRDCEEHHRYTVDLAPQINWTASPSGMIEEASPRWMEVTGIEPQNALGIGWLSAVHPEDVAPTIASWTASLEAKVHLDVEYRLRTLEGEHRWFRARAAPRLDERGEVVRWYGTLENIDDRRRAETDLRESEERFRLAAHAANLGIWDFDAINDRREWSDEFKEMLGLPRDTAPEVDNALPLVVPEDRHLLEALIDAVHAGDSNHRFDITLRVRRADTGDERWMRTSGWRIHAPGGRLERILVTIRDVTEEYTAEQRVRWAASHDSLTCLPNRADFTDAFEAAIARAEANGSTLALVLFDIDNLKVTNDTIGHDAGDLLLLTFARRLIDNLGPGAFISRLGGDEFAAFMETKCEADVVSRISATLEALREPFLHEDSALDCQATAGAAFFPREGTSATDLLKNADIALYAGKAGQRGGLSTFQPEMRANIQRRASMLSVARTALRDRRILPFYQPKVDLTDGRIVGFEALLRWRHDMFGIQSPETVAAAFEDLNLATALGERMLDCICDDIARWLDRGLDIGSVAFNVSPAEFRRDDLFDRVLERLHHGAIPPSILELEITETVFMGRGAEAVAATLGAFHREGMKIALDDFGTGYASLTHLQAFPVDVIKIDRSFVANVTAGTGDAAIVDAVIGLAGRLGMSVVAEGIETQAQADYLTGRGCTHGQGYLFGRASSAEDVEALVRDGYGRRAV